MRKYFNEIVQRENVANCRSLFKTAGYLSWGGLFELGQAMSGALEWIWRARQ